MNLKVVSQVGRDPYTEGKCIGKSVAEVYAVDTSDIVIEGLDPKLDEILSVPKVADKLFGPIAEFESPKSKRYEVSEYPINYDSENNALKLGSLDLKLNKEWGTLLPCSIYEAEILKKLKGKKNILGYIDNFFSIMPTKEGDKLGLYHVIRTDYVEGKNLMDSIFKTGVDFWTAAKVVVDLAEAIYSCHSFSLVHRDIKPSNVMLKNTLEEVKTTLVDFGIATFTYKNIDSNDCICGSFGYMAPEQVIPAKSSDGKINNMVLQIDAYSLAIVALETFTGKKTFKIKGDDIKTKNEGVIAGNKPNLTPVMSPNSYTLMIAGYNAEVQQRLVQRLVEGVKHRHGLELPSSFVEAFELALHPDWKVRNYCHLANEALKLTTGISRTEDLPRIIPEDLEENVMTLYDSPLGELSCFYREPEGVFDKLLREANYRGNRK